jgi:signal transduction histidine kinase
MSPNEKPPTAEREETDESLRRERQRTDRALSDAEQAKSEDADLVVQRARDKADAVVDEARGKEDAKRTQKPRGAEQLAAVARERREEDRALHKVRADADAALRLERDETFSALAKLLPLEREKTDRYLLTERARSDDALANRDDFLSIVSHDLRNLLNGIVLSSALLSERGSGEKGRRNREGIDRIQRYAARMNRLIGDLLDVASIDAGRLAVSPQRGDAATLISESLEMFSATAAAKGIRLETELAEQPLVAEFDHDRILQVIANLISNSLKFTPQGGRIRVRGERHGEGLLLSVTDDGSGIPEAALETIFQRFWQVGKDDRRGTGLGLYISRCIVEAHGGRIWAESKPGEGSTVRFTLGGAAKAAPPSSNRRQA